MIKIKSIFRTLIVLYLLSLVLEGPFRYFLSIAGADFLIYFRDIGLVLSLIYLSFRVASQDFFLKKNSLYGIMIFLFYSIVGLYFTGNIVQVFFGVKILLPVLLGVVLYNSLCEGLFSLDKIGLYSSIILLVIIFGVVLNYFVAFPWAELVIEIEGQEIAVGKNLTYLGFFRPTGFTKSSEIVSKQLILFGLVSVVIGNSKVYLKSILWIITGIAIVLTTTKGIIVSYLLCSIVLMFYTYQNRFTLTFLTLQLFLLMIGVPTYFLFFESKMDISDPITKLILLSFKVRAEVNWPRVLEFMSVEQCHLIGRGIGGIGSSQKIFELYNYVSPDNLFLFVYSTFGVLGVIGMTLTYMKLLLKFRKDSVGSKFFILVVMVILSFGIISTAIEEPFYGVFFGLVVGYIVSEKSLRQIVKNI